MVSRTTDQLSRSDTSSCRQAAYHQYIIIERSFQLETGTAANRSEYGASLLGASRIIGRRLCSFTVLLHAQFMHADPTSNLCVDWLAVLQPNVR